jgi:hypothetical protein
MIVTPDQMRVMNEAVRRREEARWVRRLREAFPESTARHPDDTLRMFARHGVERARLAAIEMPAEVERWLGLMMRLGAYFDADERLAEVRAALLGDLAQPAAARLDAAEALAERVAPAPR